MESILSQIVEQNKRIIEQNRKIQEQIDSMNVRIQSLEKKIEFANAVSVVNNRSVSILSGVGNIFSDEDQEEALQMVKNQRDEEQTNLIQIIDLSRTKYI